MLFCPNCKKVYAFAGDADAYKYLVESIRRFPDMPSFRRMIEQAGFTQTRVEPILGGLVAIILADLFLARSEAIERRLRVVVCRSADGASCALSGSWEQGWIVFADADGNGQRAPGEPLVRVQQALPAGVRLTGTATMAKYVSYAPTGAAKTIGGGFQAGTLTVCTASPGTATARRIIISSSGMLEGGRILHHLRNRIGDPRNTILFTSWQAPMIARNMVSILL